MMSGSSAWVMAINESMVGVSELADSGEPATSAAGLEASPVREFGGSGGASLRRGGVN